ncbi:hypothetical protein [uncultured Helicobacter sp.]|uniref:hypothetical protein n=1 Tax=uncultured Helicobacter sp. TaxID=175537 RepID=UPI00374E5F3F
MSNLDIYLLIVSFFQESLEGFSNGLVKAVTSFVNIKILLNAIGMFVIITYAVKKLQEGDFFTWKNAIGVILMITYLGVFNLSLSNPTTFMDFFYSLITYPAQELSNQISKQTALPSEVNSSGMSPVGYLINKTLITSTEIFNRLRLAPEIGMPFFGDGIEINGDLFAMILAGLLVALALIYVVIILLIIVAAEFQLFIWKSIALIIVLLLFIPQTRGMVGAYVKFLLGLTFYKPFVIVLAFMVFNILNYILTNLPQKNAYWEMSIEEVALNVYPLLFGGIFGIFIGAALLKQVPSFINQVIGATSSVGMGIAAAGQKAMAGTTGATAGATGGFMAGRAKSAYQGAGGGIGGIASAAAGVATGGASGLAGKGIKALAQKKGIQTSGSMGQMINNKLNQTGVGAKANDVVSKGVSTGANAVKELGKKISGKGK